MSESKIKVFLTDLYKKFETKQRDATGKDFVSLNHTATDADSDFIRKVHSTDMLPDDFRFKTIESLIGSILDVFDFDHIENETSLFRKESENHGHEIIDGTVDIYNHDLLQWYSSNLNRPCFVTEAAENGLINNETDEMQRLMSGQFEEISQIYYRLIEAIENEDFEDLDD